MLDQLGRFRKRDCFSNHLVQKELPESGFIPFGKGIALRARPDTRPERVVLIDWEVGVLRFL